MTSIDQDRFLDLVYSAPAQPGLWVTVMEQLADMIGGGAGWLSAVNVSDGGGAGLIMRTDPIEAERYFSHYAAINPLNNVSDPDAYFRDWRPQVLTDEDWMPRDELLMTEYYNDFIAPQDVGSTVMIRLAAGDGEVSCINIGRSIRKGRFEAEELEIARHFHPHLIRAYRLSQALAKTHALEKSAGEVFEASPHALFLIGGDGRVVRCNRTAETVVRARMGLCLSAGRLTTPNTGSSTRLAGLIAAALSNAPRTGGWMAIELPDRILPLSVTVTPVGDDQADVFCRDRCAMVTVTNLEAFTPPPEQKLRELFGLTPAEVRLVLMLLEGHGLKEAAGILGIAVNTATVHLSHIFEKTGCNRQSTLLAVMSRAAGPGDAL